MRLEWKKQVEKVKQKRTFPGFDSAFSGLPDNLENMT